MRLNTKLIPIGALALVLGAGGFSAEAAQRSGRREGSQGQTRGQARERSGGQAREQSGGQSRERSGSPARDGGAARQEPRGNQSAQSNGRDARGNNQAARGNNGRSAGREQARDNNRARPSDGRNGSFRGGFPNTVRRPAYRHYYGSGGGLSVYFGLGGGYRYGAPYSGRVYGYRLPSIGYGSRRYYGDVRLEIRPRDAQVYVDGYYAGLVDDFDGIFQRLTLEVGQHEIEVEAPGFEPRVFNVYVDATRTVDLRGDLYSDRPY